jgi:K+-sensing histidine kinase KdpD
MSAWPLPDLKVFLGMAAGVGKTYRMLQEGTRGAGRRARRRDRLPRAARPPETAALAEGSSRSPRMRVEPTAALALEEMDVAGDPRARPSWPDRRARAHERPGASTPSATRTSTDVLAAGIDVISTVNVQHLESLNDRSPSSPASASARRSPTRILEDADEVVLVDLARGAARAPARRQGLPPSASSGAQQLLPIENLSALREVALRQVAEERRGQAPVRHILLPFSGQQISRRSFEAAVRLAKAEDAIIMPAFLATRADEPAARERPAAAVRPWHAAARGDRAACLLAGRGRSTRAWAGAARPAMPCAN